MSELIKNVSPDIVIYKVTTEVFISIFSTTCVFFAGKDEDFCLRKIERIIYVLIVITLNIHKKESICYKYIVFIFVNIANLLRMKTKINNVYVAELSSVGKIDTRRFLFNRTFVVGSFSMCYWSTFLLNDSK